MGQQLKARRNIPDATCPPLRARRIDYSLLYARRYERVATSAPLRAIRLLGAPSAPPSCLDAAGTIGRAPSRVHRCSASHAVLDGVVVAQVKRPAVAALEGAPLQVQTHFGPQPPRLERAHGHLKRAALWAAPPEQPPRARERAVEALDAAAAHKAVDELGHAVQVHERDAHLRGSERAVHERCRGTHAVQVHERHAHLWRSERAVHERCIGTHAVQVHERHAHLGTVHEQYRGTHAVQVHERDAHLGAVHELCMNGTSAVHDRYTSGT